MAALSTPLRAQTPVSEFRKANGRLEQLLVSNNPLRQRMARQDQLIIELATSIEYAAMLFDEENSLLKDLVERMMVSMEQLVEADRPFEIGQRRQAVSRIRGLVDKAAAPRSQKIQMLKRSIRLRVRMGERGILTKLPWTLMTWKLRST